MSGKRSSFVWAKAAVESIRKSATIIVVTKKRRPAVVLNKQTSWEMRIQLLESIAKDLCDDSTARTLFTAESAAKFQEWDCSSCGSRAIAKKISLVVLAHQAAHSC